MPVIPVMTTMAVTASTLIVIMILILQLLPFMLWLWLWLWLSSSLSSSSSFVVPAGAYSSQGNRIGLAAKHSSSDSSWLTFWVLGVGSGQESRCMCNLDISGMYVSMYKHLITCLCLCTLHDGSDWQHKDAKALLLLPPLHVQCCLLCPSSPAFGRIAVAAGHPFCKPTQSA